MEQDSILNDIVQRLVQSFEPEKIILFGSRARGDNSAYSDIDLLIIDSNSFNKERSRFTLRNKMRNVLAKVGGAKDILLYSKDEFEYWKDYKNHILFTCVNEGRVLYEKH